VSLISAHRGGGSRATGLALHRSHELGPLFPQTGGLLLGGAERATSPPAPSVQCEGPVQERGGPHPSQRVLPRGSVSPKSAPAGPPEQGGRQGIANCQDGF